MNIAVRDVIPTSYCTRTQHIELRVAKADDAGRIAELFGEWFPASIWNDCLTFDQASGRSTYARRWGRDRLSCLSPPVYPTRLE
jgi:hypothetical protein